MYSKKMLGMEESQAAIAAMIEEFKKDPESPPAAFAVVDDNGLLLAYARTDGSRPIISKNAIRKAYTASQPGLERGCHGRPYAHRSPRRRTGD